MAIIILGNLFVFIVVSFIATLKGLDLQQRSSWWYGLYGFVSGFLLGFINSEEGGGYHIVTNLTGSFLLGTLFAVVVLIGSATTRWQRNMGEKYLAHSEEDYQEKLGNLAESLFKDKSNRK